MNREIFDEPACAAEMTKCVEISEITKIGITVFSSSVNISQNEVEVATKLIRCVRNSRELGILHNVNDEES